MGSLLRELAVPWKVTTISKHMDKTLSRGNQCSEENGRVRLMENDQRGERLDLQLR